jgi:hypothetical protein
MPLPSTGCEVVRPAWPLFAASWRQSLDGLQLPVALTPTAHGEPHKAPQRATNRQTCLELASPSALSRTPRPSHPSGPNFHLEQRASSPMTVFGFFTAADFPLAGGHCDASSSHVVDESSCILSPLPSPPSVCCFRCLPTLPAAFLRSRSLSWSSRCVECRGTEGRRTKAVWRKSLKARNKIERMSTWAGNIRRAPLTLFFSVASEPK